MPVLPRSLPCAGLFARLAGLVAEIVGGYSVPESQMVFQDVWRRSTGTTLFPCYLDREPVGDSGRMRIRLRTLAMSFDSLVHSIIVQEELGVELVNWQIFFDDAEMRDVLDFVTIAYRHLAKQSHTGAHNARKWQEGVQRIFTEENVHYRVADLTDQRNTF